MADEGFPTEHPEELPPQEFVDGQPPADEPNPGEVVQPESETTQALGEQAVASGSNPDQTPAYDEHVGAPKNEDAGWDSDREGRGGLTDQETRHETDEQLEAESGVYHSEHDEVDDDEDQEADPLEGDVDRYVDPKQTRSDAEIEHDEQMESRAHMSGADGADEYWDDYDEYFADKPDPKVEDRLELTEKDKEDRANAEKWLNDAAVAYQKRADELGHVSHYDGNPESKALYRVLDNGFYATSDDNVHAALRTIATGNLTRAEFFTTWQDGSYKVPYGVEHTELDLDGWREFTGKFAELQRGRQKALDEGGPDPLRNQMKDIFPIDDPVEDRWDMKKAETIAGVTDDRETFIKGLRNLNRAQPNKPSIEEFYDLNPDKFAQMPTSEFFEMYKTFHIKENDLRVIGIVARILEGDITNLESELSKGQVARDTNVSTDDMRQDVWRLLATIREPDATKEDGELRRDQLIAEIEAIFEGDYDKSPRQITEAKLAFMKKYSAQASDEVNKRKNALQEFLDSQKPQPVEAA